MNAQYDGRTTMYAITENHAGGARRTHRNIETAARRLLQDDVYLGYRLVECDSDETHDAIMEIKEEIRQAEEVM